MSDKLIAQIAVKLACTTQCALQPDKLPPYWRKTPSNLAYRLRKATGWKIKGYRQKVTGRIIFERTPLTREPKNKKQNATSN